MRERHHRFKLLPQKISCESFKGQGLNKLNILLTFCITVGLELFKITHMVSR